MGPEVVCGLKRSHQRVGVLSVQGAEEEQGEPDESGEYGPLRGKST